MRKKKKKRLLPGFVIRFSLKTEKMERLDKKQLTERRKRRRQFINLREETFQRFKNTNEESKSTKKITRKRQKKEV